MKRNANRAFYYNHNNNNGVKLKIYVGNLDRSVSEDDLKELFEAHGTVVSHTIIKDRYTNESRGFGFVEMSSAEEANSAIKTINGQMLKGRSLTVNEAREREPRSRDSSGGGGFGGGQRFNRGSEGGFNRRSDDSSSRGGYRGSSDRKY